MLRSNFTLFLQEYALVQACFGNQPRTLHYALYLLLLKWLLIIAKHFLAPKLFLSWAKLPMTVEQRNLTACIVSILFNTCCFFIVLLWLHFLTFKAQIYLPNFLYQKIKSNVNWPDWILPSFGVWKCTFKKEIMNITVEIFSS